MEEVNVEIDKGIDSYFSLEGLVELMKEESDEHEFDPYKIYPSSLGYCPLKPFCREEFPELVDISPAMIFGKMFHLGLQQYYAENTDLELSFEEKRRIEVGDYVLSGRYDLADDEKLVEIKTSVLSSYQLKKKRPYDEHCNQLRSYLTMYPEFEYGELWYFNKKQMRGYRVYDPLPKRQIVDLIELTPIPSFKRECSVYCDFKPKCPKYNPDYMFDRDNRKIVFVGDEGWRTITRD